MSASAPASAHLSFERLSEATLDAFVAIARDGHVRRYLLDGELVDRGFGEAALGASDALFAARGVGLWIVRHEDAPIGFAGFHVFAEHGPEPELLYALLEPHTGRGLATEAATALITFARERGFTRVVAAVDEPNVASIRVLEKLGFARTHDSPGAFGRTVFLQRSFT